MAKAKPDAAKAAALASVAHMIAGQKVGKLSPEKLAALIQAVLTILKALNFSDAEAKKFLADNGLAPSA